MFISIACIMIIEFILSYALTKFKFTKILGYLLAGILIGPYVLDLLDIKLLNISTELRQIALIIILIKAGLTLSLNDLKKIGRPAILMSFLPATFEIIAYTIFAPILFNISAIEAALMGSVMSAVSPAIVVPRMVYLIENKYGTKKSIPQLIMAGASCDDIFVIVLFTSFLTTAKGSNFNLTSIIDVPVSIVSGILIGAIAGLFLSSIFKLIKGETKATYVTMAIIASSFLLISAENFLKPYFEMSGLLAIISMSLTIKEITNLDIVKQSASNFGYLWLGAQIFLFILVGAEVNIHSALAFGFKPIIIIFLALFVRAIGVYISLIKTHLNSKEKLFTILAYIPKATVQAAIGSVPLAAGVESGLLILTTAVLGILITAPIGAILIDRLYKGCLTKDI